METDVPLDIEQFRTFHESSTEWDMRRSFMTTHWSKFSVARLICLANCYVNVHCYGARYPPAVMTLLKDLIADLPQMEKSQSINYHARNQVKFVKSTEASGAAPMETAPKTGDVGSIFDTPTAPAKKPSPNKMGLMFVKATDSYESTDRTKAPADQLAVSSQDQAQAYAQLSGSKFKDTIKQFQKSTQNQQDSKLLQKFYTLSSHVRNFQEKRKGSIETIHLAVDKVQMLASPIFRTVDARLGRFSCELKIDFVTISMGEGNSKKVAKVEAFDKACDKLRKPYLKIVETNTDTELHSSDEPLDEFRRPNIVSPRSMVVSAPVGFTKLGQSTRGNIHALAKPTKGKKKGPAKFPIRSPDNLSHLLLVEPQRKPDCVNPISILRQSADINKVQYDQTFTDVGCQVRCVLSLGGQPIVDMNGPSRLVLKSLTAQRALETLREICWTIQVKKNEDCEEEGISRDNLLGDIKSEIQSGKIGDSNIGNQLLRKMGWTGGGLGKDSKGISEPIAAGGVINREGLGLRAEQGISKDFLPQMKETLRQYICSHNQGDITFSPDFQKEERALIHKEAQKLGLKTHSHGSGDERYLVVSRKRNVGELFTHVMQSGGETSKYVLVPPGEHTDTASMFDG